MPLVARADMAVACARVVEGVPGDGERRLASKFRSSSAPALQTAASPHSHNHNGEAEPSREHLPRPGRRRRVAGRHGRAGDQIRCPARPCSHSAAAGPTAPTRGRAPPGRLHKRAGRTGSGSFQKLRFGPFPPRSLGGRDGCVGWGSEELGGEHAAARAAHAAAPLARVPRGGTPKGERDDGEEGGQGRKEGRGGVGREGGWRRSYRAAPPCSPSPARGRLILCSVERE